MTIVSSDSRFAAADLIEPGLLQFQQTSSVQRATDPSPSVSANPSPFELLFARQLGQSFETSLNAENNTTESAAVSGDGLTLNSLNSTETKAKSATNDDGAEFTSLVNPLTMSLFTLPLPTVFEELTSAAGTSTSASATQDDTGIQNSTDTEASASSRESAASETSAAGGQSVEEEEPQSDLGSYSSFIANQSTEMSTRFVPSQSLYSQQAIAAAPVQNENRESARFSTSDSPAIESRLTVGSHISLSSSDRKSDVNDTVSVHSPFKITSMTTSGPTQHFSKQEDQLIPATSLIVPLTSFGGTDNIESSAALTEQLAATIEEHLQEESEDGSTSIRMHLDHPELGIIELYLSLANNAVSIRIVAKNAQTKRMIEDQMDDLREKLTNNGVTCGPFQVASPSSHPQLPEPDESEPHTITPTPSASAHWARTQTAAKPSGPSNSQLNVVA